MKKISAFIMTGMFLVIISCTTIPELPDTHNQREQYLVDLASRGKTKAIQKILRQYPNVNLNYIDEFGFAALHYAIGYKYDKTALMLIEQGANVELPTQAVWHTLGTINEGATPLHIAIFWSRTNIATRLLQKNANPNAQDSLGWTPLHVVAYYGIRDPVDLLLDSGAKNIPDKEGKTPLTYAHINGYSVIEKKISSKTKD